MALSAKRLKRKTVILAKIETDYGVSAAPTGAANAILIVDPTFMPFTGDEVKRELVVPYLGNQGSMLVGSYVELQFSVELAGAGTAGTAPAYGSLLRACAMSETIVAATSVTYAPVSDAMESVTILVNVDGVQHTLLGCRGTFTLEVAPKTISRIRFTLRGLIGAIADVALPASVFTGFKTPVPVSKAATTVSLHGYAAIAESLSIDRGNTVEPRHLIGEESIQIVDSQATGRAVLEAKSIATKDWYSIAAARTRGALSCVHGVAAGNICEIAAAAVEVGRPEYGDTQGIRNNTFPLGLCTTAGNDDFSIIVR